MRTCAVCRQVRPKRAMTRLVRSGESALADRTGKAAGRGTYVCDDPACREPQRLAEAVRRALGVELDPRALEEVRSATA
jgi:predicted RNA-binding protein YlxR (DUF448 family)